MGLIERVINGLKDRRDNILKGGINCIPLPFPRFRKEFPGIEQATYYLVSGATKAGKTQLANFIFVYNTLIYAYQHLKSLRAKHLLLSAKIIYHRPLTSTAHRL